MSCRRLSSSKGYNDEKRSCSLVGAVGGRMVVDSSIIMSIYAAAASHNAQCIEKDDLLFREMRDLV
jgi:hypothetical protein